MQIIKKVTIEFLLVAHRSFNEKLGQMWMFMVLFAGREEKPRRAFYIPFLTLRQTILSKVEMETNNLNHKK